MLLITVVIACTAVVSFALYLVGAVDDIQTTYRLRQSTQNLNRLSESALTIALNHLSQLPTPHHGSRIEFSFGKRGAVSIEFYDGDTAHPNLSPVENSIRRTIVINTRTSQNGISASRQSQAIVRLIPVSHQNATSWPTLSQFSLVQTDDTYSQLQGPFQIQGNASVSHRIHFWPRYPRPEVKQLFFSHLDLMRKQSGIDARPFTGQISVEPGSSQNSRLNQITNTYKGAATSGADLELETNLASHHGTYQLFEGGKQYSIPLIDSLIGFFGRSKENPLGIYELSRNAYLTVDAQVDGTLLTDREITFRSGRFQFSGTALPTNLDTGIAARMPALIGATINVAGNSVVTTNGPFLAGNLTTYGGAKLECNGTAVARKLVVLGVNGWTEGQHWLHKRTAYETEVANGDTLLFFPEWLRDKHGLDYAQFSARFAPGPPNSQALPNLNLPIYQPANGSPGLEWELLQVEVVR